MYQKIRKQTEGFTIIEVLIVLAIAGLILLIVFLAVPALQRNSRNNGRRNDITRIAAAVNDHVANNNGNLPTEAQMAGIMGFTVGNLAQYTTTDRVANATGAQNNLGLGTPRFRLVTAAQCDTTAAATGNTVAGSSRQAALQYMLESGTAGVPSAACLNI